MPSSSPFSGSMVIVKDSPGRSSGPPLSESCSSLLSSSLKLCSESSSATRRSVFAVVFVFVFDAGGDSREAIDTAICAGVRPPGFNITAVSGLGRHGKLGGAGGALTSEDGPNSDRAGPSFFFFFVVVIVVVGRDGLLLLGGRIGGFSPLELPRLPEALVGVAFCFSVLISRDKSIAATAVFSAERAMSSAAFARASTASNLVSSTASNLRSGSGRRMI
jgi:hypothetical protein